MIEETKSILEKLHIQISEHKQKYRDTLMHSKDTSELKKIHKIIKSLEDRLEYFRKMITGK